MPRSKVLILRLAMIRCMWGFSGTRFRRHVFPKKGLHADYFSSSDFFFCLRLTAALNLEEHLFASAIESSSLLTIAAASG